MNDEDVGNWFVINTSYCFNVYVYINFKGK